MASINRLFFVLGLLVSAGSLVNGRYTIGRPYGGSDVYRSEDYDYTAGGGSDVYTTGDVYSGSDVYPAGDYDYTTHGVTDGSDVYTAGDYDYTTHGVTDGSDVYTAGDYDYTTRGGSDMYRGIDDFHRGSDDVYRGGDDVYRGRDDVHRGGDVYTGNRGSDDVYRGSDIYRGGDYDYTSHGGTAGSHVYRGSGGSGVYRGSNVQRGRDSDHAYASTEPVRGWSDWDVQEGSYQTQQYGFTQQDGFIQEDSTDPSTDASKHHGHHGQHGSPSQSPASPPSGAAPPTSGAAPPTSGAAPPTSGAAPPTDSGVAPAPSSSNDRPPTGNPIDDCWRHDTNWPYNRQALAKCAIGFGMNALGGANGPVYVVTDNTDEDLVNPKEGTLRYAVVKEEPLWIGFSRDMNITLQNELIMSSFKTIDGRGFDIHISGGAGITIQYIHNVIVHGIHMHDLVPTPPAIIRSNSSHSGHRQGSDGDAINIFGSHDVWVDHCYFARGSDGLVDAIMGSTNVSVTNNFFEEHDKVMLFGAHPFDTMDDGMQVSVAFNHFAPGLIERVPRVRHGHAHVFNNYYASWGEYAIGGSEAPTILSQGNVFNAPNTRDKQVTKRIDDGDASFQDSKNWNWQSVGDQFLNGAFFVSGGAAADSSIYSKAASTSRVVPAIIVPDITKDAGPLKCPPSGGLC